MLELTAVFESWLIGDGDYPPLDKGMLVNLSFNVEPHTLTPMADPVPLSFAHLGNAEYRFCAEVQRNYDNGMDGGSLLILSTGELRFYVESHETLPFQVGSPVQGTGTLLLDYYIWVESLLRHPERFPDPPDLFYTLEVTRIRQVRIPEDFIRRSEKGMAGPTYVPPGDFGEVTEVETMRKPEATFQFYLVDFRESTEEGISRTFT